MSSSLYCDDSGGDTPIDTSSSEISPTPDLSTPAPAADEIARFTCDSFRDNSAKCQPYNCQTPSNVDPTQTIQWNILNKKEDRCVISNTSTDVGLQDEKGNPKPVTKTCEYDQDGVSNLADIMDDLKAGHFNATQNANLPGSYHCDISSEGNPINQKPNIILPGDDG
jgi:hypothetical protein